MSALAVVPLRGPAAEVLEQLRTLDSERADGICRNPRCPCPEHRQAELALVDAYGFGALGLSATEARLLAALLPPWTLVARDVLIVRVFGVEYRGEYHLLRVNLARVRRKLRESGSDWKIATRIGIGYRLTGRRIGP